jgi:prepilin-type N-terminal cleavage/methylation domain-containing protein
MTTSPPTTSISSPLAADLKTAVGKFRRRSGRGFTLVELLLVVAIVSILAAMVISHFAEAATGARNVVAQQQLAVWQSALSNWVNSRLGKIDTTIDVNGSQISVTQLSNYYNNLTRRQRFVLLTGKDLNGTAGATQGYIEAMTVDHFLTTMNGTGANNTNKIQSAALLQTNQWLELPAWSSSSYPQVTIFGAASGRTAPADTSKL